MENTTFFFFFFSRLFVCFHFENLIVMAAATVAAANPHLSQKKTNLITTANTLYTHTYVQLNVNAKKKINCVKFLC